MTRALALAALVAAATACGPSAQQCKPGTIFVTLRFDAAAMGADGLAVHVTVAGNTLNARVPYSGGDTLQISFPDGQYPAGATADVVIEALAGDVVLSTTEDPSFVLPQSCGTALLAFGDAGLGDLGVADFPPGTDLSYYDIPPPLLRNGDGCSSGSDCQSTFCVDGVCCDAGCDGQCEACDVTNFVGKCVGLPSGQPHGARAACTGTAACAGSCSPATRAVCTFPGANINCRAASCTGTPGLATLPAGCNSAGDCDPLMTQPCTNGCGATTCLGACTVDADCTDGSKPFCNLPAGLCLPTKGLGKICAVGGDCTSTHCTDGVCCNADCTGQCQACNLVNNVGSCTTVTSGAPVTGAGTTRGACQGSGACVGVCNGSFPDKCFVPTASTPCTQPACASGVLTPAALCNGSGTCGTATPGACPSNQCQDTTSCLPACANDTQCGSNRWCDGAGVCHPKAPDGGGCSGGNNQCLNNHCVGTVCCAAACGGTTPVCAADGSKCACTASSCGSLGAQYSCSSAGDCVCAPACSGKTCGADGCGGSCGTCPAATPTCTAAQVCACTATSCGAGRVCNGGACCTPSCAGKQCGADGCGGSCGGCGANQRCVCNTCVCSTCGCP